MDTVRVKVASCLICCRELSIDELMDVALQTIYAQDFDPNIELQAVHADDVGPPIVKLIDAKCHVSLLSSFLLLETSLYYVVNEIISFQKLVGNLDKMAVVNLGRQHQKTLNSYFKSSLDYLCWFGVMSCYFIPFTLLKLLCIFSNSCYLCFYIP